MNEFVSFLSLLASRRFQLGMSYTHVAKCSGLPAGTVKRILNGSFRDPSFHKVSAIANILGAHLVPQEIPVHELREKQARTKANFILRMVQGTFGLEGQAVDADTRSAMEEQTFHELLAGPNRKLWCD
jgi:transcriptional regulator with XRE-family HTH domain